MTPQQLIDENLDLVESRSRYAASRYQEEYGEFMTSGYIGLVEAAEQWRPDGGASFRTYARNMIDWSIQSQSRLEWGRKSPDTKSGENPRMRAMKRKRSLDRMMRDVHERNHVNDFVCVQPVDEIAEQDEMRHWKRCICPHNEQIAVVVDTLADGATYAEAGKAIGKSESRVTSIVRDVIRPIMQDHLSRRK